MKVFMNRTRHNKKSFSLVEALLAMTILGVAISGILTTFSSAMVAVKVSEDYSTASNLMGELRTQLRANLFDPGIVNEGTFLNYPDFSWKVTYNPTEIESLYQAMLVIQWKRGNRNYIIDYVTYHYYAIPEEEELET